MRKTIVFAQAEPVIYQQLTRLWFNKIFPGGLVIHRGILYNEIIQSWNIAEKDWPRRDFLSSAIFLIDTLHYIQQNFYFVESPVHKQNGSLAVSSLAHPLCRMAAAFAPMNCRCCCPRSLRSGPVNKIAVIVESSGGCAGLRPLATANT